MSTQYYKANDTLSEKFREMPPQLVSAVIPTRNRPELVLRAVRSALSQTHENLEVVVVIDGPDSATRARLEGIGDSRLRVLELDKSVGGSSARNRGVEHATGEWVAFLDDDDEWLPEKIEKQLDVALSSSSLVPIVSCYFIGRTPRGDYVWPRRVPRLHEPLCEYLFMRRSIFFGETQLQTSLTFARRQLFQEVPFTEGLRRHQDTDWYLRVAGLEGVKVEFVHEPLAIWYLGDHRPRITAHNNWRDSLDWLRSRQDLITPRAYAGFVATQLGPEAAQQGDWRAFFPLLREAVAVGKCHPFDILLYLGLWFTPVALRRNLRAMVRWFSRDRIENAA
jgi:glycosyltransferase involved in cell wall biosynthesis